MASNVDPNQIVSDYGLGLKRVNNLVDRFGPYQRELNRGILANMRTRVRDMYKDGEISAQTAKELGKWSGQFSGPVSGTLEKVPLFGGIFRWLFEILSKIPLVGRLVKKNFG